MAASLLGYGRNSKIASEIKGLRKDAMLNRKPCRRFSNNVLGRKNRRMSSEEITLDYMTRPKRGSGCVRSAPYNRL